MSSKKKNFISFTTGVFCTLIFTGGYFAITNYQKSKENEKDIKLLQENIKNVTIDNDIYKKNTYF